MKRSFSGIVSAMCLGLCAFVSTASAAVNLTLEPATLTVQQGEMVELALWARSEAATTVDGVEVSLAWDGLLLTLVGNDDTDTTATWFDSSFPVASSLNDDWTDGSGLYRAMASLVVASPETDLLVTTIQFTASNTDSVVTVSILDDGNTVVASGVEDALGAVAAATVTIGAGDASTGGGTTPDDGGSSDGGDSGSDDDVDPVDQPGDGGPGDVEPGDDGTTTGGDDGVDDGVDDGTDDGTDGGTDDGTDGSVDDGDGEPDDEPIDDTTDDDLTDDNSTDDDSIEVPPVTPNCGAGVVSTAGMFMVGLFLSRSKRRVC